MEMPTFSLNIILSGLIVSAVLTSGYLLYLLLEIGCICGEAFLLVILSLGLFVVGVISGLTGMISVLICENTFVNNPYTATVLTATTFVSTLFIFLHYFLSYCFKELNFFVLVHFISGVILVSFIYYALSKKSETNRQTKEGKKIEKLSKIAANNNIQKIKLPNIEIEFHEKTRSKR